MIEIEFYKLLDELKTNTYTSFIDEMSTTYYTNMDQYYMVFGNGQSWKCSRNEFMSIIPSEFQEELFKNKFENEVNK